MGFAPALVMTSALLNKPNSRVLLQHASVPTFRLPPLLHSLSECRGVFSSSHRMQTRPSSTTSTASSFSRPSSTASSSTSLNGKGLRIWMYKLRISLAEQTRSSWSRDSCTTTRKSHSLSLISLSSTALPPSFPSSALYSKLRILSKASSIGHGARFSYLSKVVSRTVVTPNPTA